MRGGKRAGVRLQTAGLAADSLAAVAAIRHNPLILVTNVQVRVPINLHFRRAAFSSFIALRQ